MVLNPLERRVFWSEKRGKNRPSLGRPWEALRGAGLRARIYGVEVLSLGRKTASIFLRRNRGGGHEEGRKVGGGSFVGGRCQENLTSNTFGVLAQLRIGGRFPPKGSLFMSRRKK